MEFDRLSLSCGNLLFTNMSARRIIIAIDNVASLLFCFEDMYKAYVYVVGTTASRDLIRKKKPICNWTTRDTPKKRIYKGTYSHKVTFLNDCVYIYIIRE